MEFIPLIIKESSAAVEEAAAGAEESEARNNAFHGEGRETGLYPHLSGGFDFDSLPQSNACVLGHCLPAGGLCVASGAAALDSSESAIVNCKLQFVWHLFRGSFDHNGFFNSTWW